MFLLTLWNMLGKTEDMNDRMILRKLIEKAQKGDEIFLTDFDGFNDMELLDTYKSKFQVSPYYAEMVKNTYFNEI